MYQKWLSEPQPDTSASWGADAGTPGHSHGRMRDMPSRRGRVRRWVDTGPTRKAPVSSLSVAARHGSPSNLIATPRQSWQVSLAQRFVLGQPRARPALERTLILKH